MPKEILNLESYWRALFVCEIFQPLGLQLTTYLINAEFALAITHRFYYKPWIRECIAFAMKILLLFAKDCNGKRDLKGNAQIIKNLRI